MATDRALLSREGEGIPSSQSEWQLRKTSLTLSYGASTVPEGKYFVLRITVRTRWMAVPLALLVPIRSEKEADVSYWPLNRLGLLQKYKLNDAGLSTAKSESGQGPPGPLC